MHDGVEQAEGSGGGTYAYDFLVVSAKTRLFAINP
jgi:hypothetical protein